jgi:ketosteroid isomerase-like protein
VQCDQYLDAGERVVVTGRFLGRGKDTGNELNAPFAHIWTLQNGKVTRFQNYTDTANWLRALYQVHIDQPVGTL